MQPPPSDGSKSALSTVRVVTSNVSSVQPVRGAGRATPQVSQPGRTALALGSVSAAAAAAVTYCSDQQYFLEREYVSLLTDTLHAIRREIYR
jgi:hypothetical protein